MMFVMFYLVVVTSNEYTVHTKYFSHMLRSKYRKGKVDRTTLRREVHTEYFFKVFIYIFWNQKALYDNSFSGTIFSTNKNSVFVFRFKKKFIYFSITAICIIIHKNYKTESKSSNLMLGSRMEFSFVKLQKKCVRKYISRLHTYFLIQF